MRFTPVYDAHNRLRVRCGDYAFTKEQACGIADLLGSLDFVEHAESNWRTGSILVMYRDGARQQVLDAVSALDRGSLPEKELPAVAQADAKFAGDLEKMLVKRVLMRLLPLPVRIAITVWNGSKYMIRALDNLLQFHMNVAVLDGTAIGASMFSGNMSTASSVMFLLGLSDMLEDYTRQRTKLALSEQLALHVDNVWVETPEGTRQIPFDQVQVGDRILVQTGSIIPFDGTVCGNVAMVNQSTMTGESEPVHKKDGDSVFAGTTVEDGKLLIEVRTLSDGSRLQEIIGLIDQSENLKAGVQSKAEHLADSIVPYSFLGFALTALLTGNMTRAVSVLMVDFSCAIKLSTPISVISAMREAAEHGTAVKGGKYLEAYAAADTIVFDKTGTLTNACPKVTDVVPFGGNTREYVLRTAACLEEHFPHSVAAAVVEAARNEGLNHEEEHAEVEYLVAHGVATTLHGERAIIGSAHFVFEDEGIPLSDADRALIEEKSNCSSTIFLAIGGKLAGMLVINDPVREEAAEVISGLRSLGITHVCMLTGDAEPAAKRIAGELGIDAYVSQVLPAYKSEFVNKLKEEGHKVIMVGDGVNDTPALAAADVSVAMCGGSDIAREVADVTLCSDTLRELVTLRRLSTALMERINANYRFIVGFNAGLIILGAVGVIPPSTAALLHNGSTMIISGKSMTKLLR